jgi:hypothetical protein
MAGSDDLKPKRQRARTQLVPDEDRAALQVLLRAAQEALALLPDESLYVRSCRMLEDGLLDVLGG